MGKQTVYRNPVFATALMILLAGFLSARTQAQTAWTDPISLSHTPGQQSASPRILADRFGGVNVFWTENYGGAPNAPDTIMYTRNNGNTWSTPADILVAPAGGMVGLGGRALNQDGELVIVWGDSNHLYYSRAQPLVAQDARAWQTDTLYTGSAGWPDVFIDVQGNANVMWGDGDGSIKFMRGDTLGQWTEPMTVWAAGNRKGMLPRIVVDKQDVIHASWSEISAEQEWNASGVWYGRSTDNGASWTDLLYEPDRGWWINVGLDKDENMHLVWEHGVWSTEGRWHRISTDHGLTWSTPSLMFSPGPLNGLTRWPVMAVDSAGVLHYVTPFNAGYVNGVYYSGRVLHSVWQGGNWGQTEIINASDGNPHALGEFADIAISSGNQLHVVYHDAYPDSLEIWYTTRQVAAPAIIAESEPKTTGATGTVAPIIASTPPQSSPVPRESTTPTKSIPLDLPATAFESKSRGNAEMLLLSGLPALLLVIGTMVVYITRRRRWRR